MAFWADLLLAAHFAWAAFMAAGLPLGLALRSPRLRWAHAAGMALTIGFVLAGRSCPLTVWEESLRGPGFSYGGSFLARHLGPVLYPDLSPALLDAASLVWAGATALSLLLLPPRRAARETRHGA